MPLYEYHCQACDQTHDALRPMDQADEPLHCEHCGSDDTHRVQSVFTAGASAKPSTSLPMGGCGRCGDPAGPCAMG